MSRQNVAFLKFNSGLISPESLARVDDPRTQLSAEVMTNWLPKTQGSMRIRPGTKYVGSSLNDTGATYIEFVAASDELALLELTANKMRIWQGSDAHDLALLGRPAVTTTVSLSDTGELGDKWSNASIGGGVVTSQIGISQIPTMTAATTNGVTIDASSEVAPGSAWKAADGSSNTAWLSDAGLPQWIRVDFGAGSTRRVKTLVLKSASGVAAPQNFTLQGSSDGSAWTTEITASATWNNNETKQFEDTGFTDTGANAWRYWRVNTSSVAAGAGVSIAEMGLLDAADTGQVALTGAGLRLNAGAVGSLARARRAVTLGDTGTEIGVEHSLAIHVSRGPVTIRVGSALDADDLITDTELATGYHNLSFTPTVSVFVITLQTDAQVDRVVSSLTIGDSGTVEITTPWEADDLNNIRFDQSADVVFVNCNNVKQYQIERRGTDTGSNKGRSWSVVEYTSDFGPFRLPFGQSAKLDINNYYGNAELTSDIPIFQPGHEGALFRITHSGQSSKYKLGNKDAATEAVSVVGINDTGKNDSDSERVATFAVSGTYTGTVVIERSFESPDFGFSTAIDDNISSGNASDTGTFSTTVRDVDDNLTVYYRARMDSWTSGTAIVTVTNKSGVKSGVVRCTDFNNDQSLYVEVLRQPSDTGLTPDWEEGAWSGFRGFPSAVALHEGRLAHAGEASVWLSTSDDYANFDDEGTGDAGPIARTFGSGPVQRIINLTSAELLIAGTADSEIAVRSSSFDEILVPSNTAARRVSTLGSGNVRTIKRNRDIFFVQRSGKNLYRMVASSRPEESEPLDLTILAPDVLASGVVSMAIQREPDTRVHCVLADGTVAILTYEPNEEMIAWSKWAGDTGTGATVERAMVLPGTTEDAVYYHVRRTINGVTKRYLEKWALEEESIGDTGLTFLMDSALVLTAGDSGVQKIGATHLAGASIVAVAQDTGQAAAMRDLSPDVSGVQTKYTVGDSGHVILDTGNFTNVVGGLPYTADWKSTKLAYGAQAGTALAQLKRTDKIGFVLFRTHNNGLFFGNDTGQLDPLSRMIDGGAQVDPDKIFTDADLVAMPFPGLWSSDSRIYLRGKSPRPVTVLAAVPTVQTNEKL